MAANSVSTTTPGMHAAATKLDGTVESYINQLRTVNQEMAALQTSWTGDASTRFNTAMDSWEAGFQRVINALIGLSESMGVNVKLYTQQEEEASQIAGDFGGGLDLS
ncbi:hypothetical protein GCM10010435_41040 [Winogradskya consettensis]|uniref:ESAT-6-like protein n=1 Tax=Winogradskya consettensis TaxID=113560 RepID=A0A919SDF5_9ACTN|nr:WXG100 family type VII secretion target [Actinoplanes consettensis]GIM69811.1 hypothetical protein Aco04nite_17170 [Actinoplanes consettensis]